MSLSHQHGATGTLELGAGEDPDPRADTTLDVVDLDGIDVVHDLADRPWPFADGAVDEILAHHVVEHLAEPAAAFAEMGRVLRDGGRVEVTVPIGLDARTDPTHEHEWTWDTAEYFVANAPYDYGWGLPFDLEDRAVDWWLNGPFARAQPLVAWWVNRHGPGKWLSGVPGLSGELTCVYRRRER